MAWNAAGQPITSGKSNKSHEHANSNFWDDVIGLSSQVNGSNQRGQPKKGFNDFPPMAPAETKLNKRDTRDQEIINRIFQQPTANSEFVDWVDRNLPAVKNMVDVPTVVVFLQEVESPHEINDYMSNMLGESPEKNLFVREFLARRNKLKKVATGGGGNGENLDKLSSSGCAVVDDEGFEEMKKNKKKKKMQKLDPTMLGFQCNAAPESLNRDGGLESSADAMNKSKK